MCLQRPLPSIAFAIHQSVEQGGLLSTARACEQCLKDATYEGCHAESTPEAGNPHQLLFIYQVCGRMCLLNVSAELRI